jgi:peptide/nickel transport system permease protein
MGVRILVKHLARVAVIVLAAGLLASSLVRFAPAFGVSGAELDPRLSGEYSRNLADQHGQNVWSFYVRYLRAAVVGDFGISPSLQRPIGDLLRERLPVSLQSLGIGVGVGVGAGIGLAILVITFRSRTVEMVPVAASVLLLSVPSAALALLFLVAGWPPSLSLAAVVFPRVYRYAEAVLSRSASAPYVMAARARGLSSWRVLVKHIVPSAAPQLLAVFGMAVSIAFPALVPIEAVCDSPGVLQLAWKAALARDLPLLVTLTMVASVVVLLGNAAADVSAEALRRQG